MAPESSSASSIEQIAKELRDLRRSLGTRIDLTQELLLRALGESSSLPVDNLSPKLSVFFEKTTRERKPYTIYFDGPFRASLNISDMRTSIIVVLLCDLAERLSSRNGIPNRQGLIEQVYSRLSNDSKNVSESVRSALYRFAYSKEGPFVKSGSFELRYNPELISFDIYQRGELIRLGAMTIELSSQDDLISRTLEETLNLTPLGRLRQQRALLTPSSPEGAQRLMLEMYECMESMEVHSVYFRPPSSLFPDSVLQAMNVSDLVDKRSKAFRNALRQETMEFHDVIHIDDLKRLVEKDETGKYSLFPMAIKAQHVHALVDEMIQLVTNSKSFHYYITRVAFPFYVVTYAAKTRNGIEKITLFFRHFSSADPLDVSCFAVRDPFVYQVMVSNIAQWLISHPTTTSSREEIIRILTDLKSMVEE